MRMFVEEDCKARSEICEACLEDLDECISSYNADSSELINEPDRLDLLVEIFDIFICRIDLLAFAD
jgi:hypothetical protein